MVHSLVIALLVVASPPKVKLPSQQVTIDGKKHTLVWTFDDHPRAQTDRVLPLLKQYKIKATFFVLTYSLAWYYRNPKHPGLTRQYNRVKKIAAEGHLVGNHSHTHPLLCKRSYKHIVRQEIGRAQKLLHKVLGKTPTLWRPPHGFTCRKLRRAVARFKLRWVWWHIGDYKVGAHMMWKKLRKRVARGKTKTILLFHFHVSRLKKFLKLVHKQHP
jgi:peptidoglycan/xylan/chitin deacetylase (PgdA/CDA1 family)